MPTPRFETWFHVAKEMGSVLPLDGFMGHLRKLPEFADLSDQDLKDLYAKNYLPWMQQQKAAAQQQAEQKRGLIGGLINRRIVSADVGGVPVDLSLQKQPGLVSGAPAFDPNDPMAWQRRT